MNTKQRTEFWALVNSKDFNLSPNSETYERAEAAVEGYVDSLVAAAVKKTEDEFRAKCAQNSATGLCTDATRIRANEVCDELDRRAAAVRERNELDRRAAQRRTKRLASVTKAARKR